MRRNVDTQELVVRLITGDITHTRATVLVVNHFNGLPPSGAERAIDAALGGAISCRAARGALDTHFGATTFLPAKTSYLAADSVLVIGLGDAEKFTMDRLPEVGVAMVQAVASLGIRDVATILHGAGSLGVSSRKSARLLMEGFLKAFQNTPGAGCLQELSIVDCNDDDTSHQDVARAKRRVRDIEQGIHDATQSANVRVYYESPDLSTLLLASARPPAHEIDQDLMPDYLRIGILREGPNLRLTLTGHDAYECSDDRSYPAEVADRLEVNLDKQVFQECRAAARCKTLRSIGEQLYKCFLSDFADGILKKHPKHPLLLCVDQKTAGLPWELLHDGEVFLSRKRVTARWLRIHTPGREASLPSTDSHLDVLIVGDSKGNLPAAAEEAVAVTAGLEGLRDIRIKTLIGSKATYEAVSRELNTHRYDVFHYAGHACYDPVNPEKSGFLLKDHLLTAEDLATRRFLPRLFFANACESAHQGDGELTVPSRYKERTYGLVESLLVSGVRAYLGSPWRVDDQAAATFALAFYAAVHEGHNIGEAVRRARSGIIKKYGESQHAWAGYALYGLPWINLRQTEGGGGSHLR